MTKVFVSEHAGDCLQDSNVSHPPAFVANFLENIQPIELDVFKEQTDKFPVSMRPVSPIVRYDRSLSGSSVNYTDEN